MHKLILAALADARTEGRTRPSLAALPPGLPATAPVPQRLAWRLATAANGPGLAQFKGCFAARREPLYALAPGWPALALGLADLARAIRCPATSSTHEVHEEKAFAAPRQT